MNSGGFARWALLSCLIALFPSEGWAWGSTGHQVVALLAQAQLTPKARAEVDRLLAPEPGQTLSSVSTWADERKSSSTAPWHYVNMPRNTCRYESERDCPDGKCVVGAIERQLAILESNASDTARLVALKWVVHFVADVHQPLHVGYASDRGGNRFQVQVFKRGSNLHALWDSGLIKQLGESPQELAKRLSVGNAASSLEGLAPAVAAEESCRIVRSEGFYPDRRVGQGYIGKFTPVAEQRLRVAGDRLAAILNRVLGNR